VLGVFLSIFFFIGAADLSLHRLIEDMFAILLDISIMYEHWRYNLPAGVYFI
jgi:hypothetical protein